MPEVTVKDLLRVLLRAEQMMVHLRKLWKNDHQNRMILRPVQPGCQGFKKLLLPHSRALSSCSQPLKLQFLQQNQPCLLNFTSICGKKAKLKSILRVHGHEICQLSKNVLICRGVFIKKVHSPTNENIIVAKSMCLEKFLSINHQVLVDQQTCQII